MKTTLEVLRFLSKSYPRQEITSETIDAYMLTLQDIPPGLLKAAALNHVTNSKWFPTIAELRGSASALVAQADGVPLPHAAWEEVKKFKREFSHPFVKRAIDRLGGMSAFGQSNTDEEMSWRAQFLSAYAQIRDQAHNERLMLPEVKVYRERLAATSEPITSLSDGMRIPALLDGRDKETAVNERRNKLFAQAQVRGVTP